MSLISILSSTIPSLINGSFQQSANEANISNYRNAQKLANSFAKSERIASQEYNSPLNQLSLMSQAGLNPNLLSGSSFEPTSGVSNQSVSPPQVQPTFQLPTEGSYSQSEVNMSSAKDLRSQQISRDAVIDGIIRMNHAQANYLIQNTKVGEATVRQIEQSITESNARMSEISAKISNIWENTRLMRVQREGQSIQNTWLPKISEAQVIKAVADANVAREQIPFFRAQASHIGQLARSLALQNDIGEANKWFTIQLGRSQYEAAKANEFIMKINRNKVAFDFGKQKQWYDIEKYLQLGSQTLGVIGQIYDNMPYQRIIDNAKGLIPGTSASPSAPSYNGWSPSSSW